MLPSTAPRKSIKKKKEKKVEPKRDLPPQVVTKQLGDNIYTGIIREDPLGSQFLETNTAKYIWNTGIRYEGPFASSQIEGKGRFSWPDGSSYEGELHNGKRHGEGLYIGHDGVTKYEGQWCMGKREGNGRLHYNASGSAFYDGEWKDGKKHGEGKQVWPSGNVYEGQWVLSKMSGFGTMTWRTGNTLEQYRGFWEDNYPHGEGTHTWLAAEPAAEASLRPAAMALQHQQQQNNRYTGQWCRGKREGVGTFYYANGAYYHGEWKNHVKQGHGRHTFEDGHVYEGPFEEDRMTQYVAPTDVDENPVCRRIDISDLQVTAYPTDHAGFEVTAGNGYLDPAKIIREVHNTLLRNLSELKELYNRYRVLMPMPGEDPFVLQNRQLWMFARDAGFVTPHCSLSRLDRVVFSGPRHLRETAPEDSRDSRPLTPKGVERRGSIESVSDAEVKEHHPHVSRPPTSQGGRPTAEASHEGDSSEEEESVSMDSSMPSPAHMADGEPKAHTHQAHPNSKAATATDLNGTSSMRFICRRTGMEPELPLKNDEGEEVDFSPKAGEPESPCHGQASQLPPKPATEIHKPTKKLLFRQFLDGIVRMSLARFPHERGLEAQIHRLFKEQVLPMTESVSRSEDVWSFLVNQDFRRTVKEFEPALMHLFRGAVTGKDPDPLLDVHTMHRFSDFGAPRRQLLSQHRIDETVRLKDVLRLLGRLGLLRPMLASTFPEEDACVPITATPEEGEDGADDGNLSADENGSGGSNSPEQDGIDEEKVPPARKGKDVMAALDSKGEAFDLERSPFDARAPYDSKGIPFGVGPSRLSFMPKSSLLSGSEDGMPASEVSESARSGAVATQRKRPKGKEQEVKKCASEGPAGLKAEDFARGDLRVSFLSVLKHAAGVMSEGSLDKVFWELNSERFRPGDESISILEYVETEIVFAEFLRLLLLVVNEATAMDSAGCGRLPLLKRFEGFLKFVLFPALETPYAPPEMPQVHHRSEASQNDPTSAEMETASAAGQEVAESGSQAPDGAQGTEADPAEVVPAGPQMLSLWRGFEDANLVIPSAEVHRTWPVDYEQQVLKW